MSTTTHSNAAEAHDRAAIAHDTAAGCTACHDPLVACAADANAATKTAAAATAGAPGYDVASRLATELAVDCARAAVKPICQCVDAAQSAHREAAIHHREAATAHRNAELVLAGQVIPPGAQAASPTAAG